MKRIFSHLTRTILFLCLLTSCTKENIKPLTIGISPWPGYDIIYYAQQANLFDTVDGGVKLVRFDNLHDSKRAFDRGKIDLLFSNIWDLTQDGSDDNEIILITNISYGSDGLVAQKEISSTSDLQGKKVAALQGFMNELVLIEALSQAGLTLNDVEVISVNNNRGEELLKNKKIAATVQWEPDLSRVKEETNGNILFTTKDTKSLVIDVLIKKKGFGHDLQIKQLLNIWFDIQELVKSRPKEVYSLAGSALNMSGDEFKQAFSGLKPGDLALNKLHFSEKHIEDTLSKLISAKGNTNSNKDFKVLYNNNYLPQ